VFPNLIQNKKKLTRQNCGLKHKSKRKKAKSLTLTKPKKCSLNGSGLASIEPFMPLQKF
jgi:hypothetical protein